MAKGLEYHWRKDSFDVLHHVAELIGNGRHSDLYIDYVKYLGLKHEGRRKDALVAADRFVATYKDDPFEIRQRVCWSLIQWTEEYWDSWPAMDGWLFPGNVVRGLINPMFEEWRRREPRNVNAWLYPLGYGSEWGAETAFLLEPNNPLCQYVELCRLLPTIGYATHELQHVGYIVVPVEEFSETIRSLSLVIHTMNDNLSDEVVPVVAWIEAVQAVNAETMGDLRPVLARRGIVEPDVFHFHNAQVWFRDPPRIGGH
jgi:hypothetical protein